MYSKSGNFCDYMIFIGTKMHVKNMKICYTMVRPDTPKINLHKQEYFL